MLSVMHRWLSRRAFLLHVEVLVIAVACGAATWWQASRALGGNGLSWFYTFEWPVLAGIAVAAWWHLIHEDPEERAARRRERAKDPAERTAEW
jgi:Na+/pantothenate symporter